MGQVSISASRVSLSLVLLMGLLPTTCESVGGGEKEVMLVAYIKERYPDFQPRAIVDVGANRGEWTRLARKAYPKAKYLMLEGTPDKDSKLKAITEQSPSNTEYRIDLLGSEQNQTVLFFQGGDTGNSMFKENTKYYEHDKGVNRTTVTLDEVIEQSSLINIYEVDILKLDVQGAEVMVMKGGTRTLEQTSFIMSETGPIEYNEGGACFYELDEFLRGHGFYLYDFGDVHRSLNLMKSQGAGQFDVLYVKPSSPRLPQELRSAKFCGQGRGGKTMNASPDSDHGPPTSTATAKSYSYVNVENVLGALESHLDYAVESKNRRPGVFFLLGMVAGVMVMFGINFCRMGSIKLKRK